MIAIIFSGSIRRSISGSLSETIPFDRIGCRVPMPIGRYGNNASFFNSSKAEIERRLIAPVDGWDNAQSL